MLRVTDEAAARVKDLSLAGGPSAGLRIAVDRRGAERAVLISVADKPEENDRVVEEYGARVFLEPAAASALHDKVLSVVEKDRRLAFAFADQPRD